MTLHSAPLVLFCVLLSAFGAVSIRVTSLVVPHQVGRGQDARLQCHFNLEGRKLYSVKWFKGSHEFFRVVPDATRPVRAFPLQELTVETQQSNASSVFLKNIQRSNAGTYRCEVSAEAPDFETDYREANMTVIDLPVQGPIVINVQASYQPGEWVSLNCTSSPSNPIAILQWYIDGKLLWREVRNLPVARVRYTRKFIYHLCPHFMLEKAPTQYVKRYVDGSLLESMPSKQQRQRQQSLSARSSEEGWESRSVAVLPDYQQQSAIVELEFIAELPMGPPVGAFSIRNATCTAFVGDIYKSETHVNLMMVDSRYSSPSFFGGNSKRPVTTFRPPSHLQSSGALSLSSGRDSDVNIKIGGRLFLSFLVSLLVGAVLTPPLSNISN